MTARIALPILDELDRLPALLDEFAAQAGDDYELWACVNQPDAWWEDPDLIAICERNQACMELLRAEDRFPVHVLDRCTRGAGWGNRGQGVGAARRLLMDSISEKAAPNDVIVSVDADASYESEYLKQLECALNDNVDLAGVAAPYRHPLSGDQTLDRPMLRYEIYLRCYALNMWRIGSRYAFTAMGSLISTRVRTYQAVGGIEPRSGGEDFYFLQKLVKHGPVRHWVESIVCPATRLSRRVPIGTGPAIGMALEEQRGRYPVFPPELFDMVATTTGLFDALYDGDVETPMSVFLREQLKTQDPWGPMRRNFRTREHFVRACHERVDGLRIFQFLRSCFDAGAVSDEGAVRNLIEDHFAHEAGCPEFVREEGWSFAGTSIASLDQLRCFLESRENALRREHSA